VQAYDQAYRLYEQMGIALGQANVMRGRGDLFVEVRDYPAAGQAFQHALDLYTASHNERGQAYAIWGLGKVAEQGDRAPAIARGYYARALEMFERLGLPDEISGTREDYARVSSGEKEVTL
jgi:tetratricopeptide (TPR) repeat protein